ncbi:MAG: hypothetical protein IKE59_00150 [Erysipelotrichaceae bacterium]|nr:hypothetical protein [Erysipelotrichaceae bacterium]
MKKPIIILLCISFLALCACSRAPEVPEEDYSESWRDRPLPASFDLRSVDTDGDGKGDRCYVTPVRFQNPFGTCWGFAAIAAAEISILGSNLKDDPNAWKTLDLSEKQLAYFTNVPLDDPENAQNGEGITPKDIHNSSQVYDRGGTGFLASSTFAQGVGPSLESSEAYSDYFTYRGVNHYADQRYLDGKYQNYSYSAQDDWTIPEELRFSRDYKLSYSHLLQSPAQQNFVGSTMYYADATRMIKEELLDKKGVLIGFCADTSLPTQDSKDGIFINLETWAHYTWAENATPNHAVTIIGWDDNYPKENFLKDHMPPEDGAWLVKNSWGSGEEPFPNSGNKHWGIEVDAVDEKGNVIKDEEGNPVKVGSGYFWLSYYDKSLHTPESFGFEEAKEEEHIYQHDYLPASDMQRVKYYDEVRMANVFTSNHSEAIEEISIITGEEATNVKYEIYLLKENFRTPADGYLLEAGEQFFDFAGFHRIPVNKELILQKGQQFAVIITLQGSKGDYYINTPIGLTLKGMMEQNAVINPRESFLYSNSLWQDYSEVTKEAIAEESYETFGGKISYDNFPIKVTTSYLKENTNIILTPQKSVISTKEGQNSTRIGLLFRSTGSEEVGNPEIEWKLLRNSEEFLSLTADEDKTGATVTAKKIGKGYVAAIVKGYGTSIVAIEVKKMTPNRYIPAISSVEYTGEEVRTDLMVLSDGNVLMKENEDYTLVFSDNIQCGIGRVEIRDETGSSYDPALFATFGIRPAQAAIEDVSVEDGVIQMHVSDQWESGISGYEVSFAPVGSEAWQNVTFTEGTYFTISLEEQGGYEVHVRAFVDVKEAEKDYYCPDAYYGEYSEVEYTEYE